MTGETPSKPPEIHGFWTIFAFNAIGFPPLYFGVSFLVDLLFDEPFHPGAEAIAAVGIGVLFGLMMAWFGTRKKTAKPS